MIYIRLIGILVIIAVLFLLLAKGFFGKTKLINKILQIQITKTKREYIINDEEKYLLLIQKNSRLKFLGLLMSIVITFYSKDNHSLLIILIFTLANFFLDSKEKKYLHLKE
ncbi:hypothetical protein SAMN05421842_10383 [Clostridium uliginosum]|uniref:Uncharacterized protein n=1 Tax=Clostridium uliginosum TaxID=119641 RepID=A0A1I1IZZ1_9CLOT|nr:hypothetical protein SAMN05421842_10383 [Clostridium uliginosum]